MTNMQISLASIVALVALGILLHIYNIWRVDKSLVRLEDREITKDDLFKDLFIPQGSVFNAMALSAWLLAFVAFAYLYFLTPAVVSDYNLFSISGLASWSFGFAAFGLSVAAAGAVIIVASDKLPESCRCFRLTELYGYYVLSKNHKWAIAMTVPLLWISILISIHLGTIYPVTSSFWSSIAYILLLVPILLILSPIIKQSLEGLL